MEYQIIDTKTNQIIYLSENEISTGNKKCTIDNEIYDILLNSFINSGNRYKITKLNR